MSGSEALLVCIVILLLFAVESAVGSSEGTNEDIAIVDWLVDTLGPSGCRCSSPAVGTGGGILGTTRWAVLSKRLSNLSTNFLGAKFAENPPCIKQVPATGSLQTSKETQMTRHEDTCRWALIRSSNDKTKCLRVSTPGLRPVLRDFITAWQYLH